MTTTDQYPCPYDQCGQSFSYQGELDEHLIAISRADDPDHEPAADDELPRTDDPGEKRYNSDVLASCPIPGCGKSFWQRGHLVNGKPSPETCSYRHGQLLRAQREGTGGPELTPREREIHELATQGLPNKQIAAQLGITISTVKATTTNIRRKLARRG